MTSFVERCFVCLCLDNHCFHDSLRCFPHKNFSEETFCKVNYLLSEIFSVKFFLVLDIFLAEIASKTLEQSFLGCYLLFFILAILLSLLFL